MFRLCLLGFTVGLLVHVPLASAQSTPLGLRQMRIVSGTVDKVDLDGMYFVVIGTKANVDDIKLSVERTTKGFDVLKEGAKVTVLYEEGSKKAFRVRLTGTDADSSSEEESGSLVRHQKTESSSTQKRKTDSDVSGTDSQGPFGPIAPPSASQTFTTPPKPLINPPPRRTPTSDKANTTPTGPDSSPTVPPGDSPPPSDDTLPEETATMDSGPGTGDGDAPGDDAGDDPGDNPAEPDGNPPADEPTPGGDEPAEPANPGDAGGEDTPPATEQPPSPERPPRPERPTPSRPT